MQASLDMSANERDSLEREHDVVKRNSQVYEGHIMELTNQVTILVREKEVVEENVRQLQRELVVREREKEELRIKMNSLQGEVNGQTNWTQEREVRIMFYI